MERIILLLKNYSSQLTQAGRRNGNNQQQRPMDDRPCCNAAMLGEFDRNIYLQTVAPRRRVHMYRPSPYFVSFPQWDLVRQQHHTSFLSSSAIQDPTRRVRHRQLEASSDHIQYQRLFSFPLQFEPYGNVNSRLARG
jgi:hypothetical protein